MIGIAESALPADKGDGLNSLKAPLHDWSSHGADALRTFACGFDDTTASKTDQRGRQGERPPRGSFWSA
jgi:hypothetical protein